MLGESCHGLSSSAGLSPPPIFVWLALKFHQVVLLFHCCCCTVRDLPETSAWISKNVDMTTRYASSLYILTSFSMHKVCDLLVFHKVYIASGCLFIMLRVASTFDR